MSRLTLMVLCSVLSFVVLAVVATPAPVRAAYVKLAYDASLQEAPHDSAYSLAMLPAGVVVTITGDPVEPYYPVTAAGKAGWIRGDALALDATVGAAPVESLASTPDPALAPAAEPVVAAPALEEPVPAEPMMEDPPTADPMMADPATAEPVSAEPVSLEPPPGEPVIADPALENPGTAATPVAEPMLVESAPEQPLAEPAPAPLPAENPSPAGPEGEAPPVAEPVPAPAEPVPSLDPNAPPVPVPDAGPVGPAAVTMEAAIFAGPGPEFGTLGVATPGALVEQTGHSVGGYVTVRYVGVTGWVSLDHLGPVSPPANS